MPIRESYFPCGGGLDVSTPAISLQPGRLISCLNFEPDIEGGYRLAKGYERFDGSGRPHKQSFVGCEVTPYIPDSFPHVIDGVSYANKTAWLKSFHPLLPDGVKIRFAQIRGPEDSEERGNAHVAGFSDAKGAPVESSAAIAEGAKYRLGVYRVTGEFEPGSIINHRWRVSPDERPENRAAPTRDVELEWLRRAQNGYRNAIRRVPGSGPIRGAWLLGGKRMYAWRDDQRAQTCKMYEAAIEAERKTRLQTVLYVRTASPSFNLGLGNFRFVGSDYSTNKAGASWFETVRALEFHPTAIDVLSGNTIQAVSVSDAFRQMTAGDIIRIKSNDTLGLFMEYVALSAPVFGGSTWQVEVEYAYSNLSGTITKSLSSRWLVDLETGIRPSAGWAEVDSDRFCKALKFNQGTSSAGVPWGPGDSITGPGGFSATIHRLVDWGGGYADNNATGVLILREVSGTIADKADIQVNSANAAKANGTLINFSFPAGRALCFDQNNFFARSGGQRLYGCASEKAFEVDEDGYISEIVIPTVFDLTGEGSKDNGFGEFRFVAAHDTHLMLALDGGLLLGSAVGNPLNFAGEAGAFQFGLGNEVVGLESIVGNVLAIPTEREVKALFGKAGTFEMRTISEKQGVLPNSVRKIDDLYGFSWAGIVGLTRTDQFGDFISDTVSNAVAPLHRQLRPLFSCSSIVRSVNQYRLHFAGKRPHYELGRFGPTLQRSSLNPATDAGSRVFHLSIPGSASPGERVLSLPKTDAMRWLESAAGFDSFTGQYARVTSGTPTKSQFRLAADRSEITIGNTGNLAFFQREDKTSEDYAGSTIYIKSSSTKDVYGTFDVRTRKSFDANTTVFSGHYRPQKAFPASGGYRIEITSPALIPDGASGKFFVRSRNQEHFYDVLMYRSMGGSKSGSSLSSDGGAAYAMVNLKTIGSGEDFLGIAPTSDNIKFFSAMDFGVKTLRDPQTESLIMYVPEHNDSASMVRGTTTKDRVEFGRSIIPAQVDAVWECPTPDAERIFFSGADGMVYEDRVGTSHDGGEIVAFMRTPFIHLGSPATRKWWRQVDLELTSKRPLQFKLSMDLDYGGQDDIALLRDQEKIAGEGSIWDDETVWDDFFWDGVAVNHARIDLQGRGSNASFLFSFKGDFIEDLVIQGLLIHYSIGRRERA